MNREASPDWTVLLEPFQSLFTKPGFRYFCVFVRVLAHLDGRLWVTHTVLSGLLARHWTNFYLFLRSPAWNAEAVARQVFARCLPVCRDGQERVFVAVDDTICKKSGKHFDGLGIHYDPMNKEHPRHLSHGHCFVALAALAQQASGHALALFVACALYVPKAVCQKGRPYQSKLQLAARLLAELPQVKTLVVVADGAYAKAGFVTNLVTQSKFLLSRLRRDAVFYDLPSARKSGQKGAPRKFGDKHKAAEWAQESDGWETVRLFLYGRPRLLRLKSREVILRRFGVTARLAAVEWASGKIVFLFSTDLTLTPAQIVAAYAARFAIETGFRDAKQSFGLTTYQVRNETSFVRLVHLCLWAQTLLRLRCWNTVPSDQYGGWRKPLAYLTLAQQKRHSASQEAFFATSGADFAEAEATRKPTMREDMSEKFHS